MKVLFAKTDSWTERIPYVRSVVGGSTGAAFNPYLDNFRCGISNTNTAINRTMADVILVMRFCEGKATKTKQTSIAARRESREQVKGEMYVCICTYDYIILAASSWVLVSALEETLALSNIALTAGNIKDLQHFFVCVSALCVVVEHKKLRERPLFVEVKVYSVTECVYFYRVLHQYLLKILPLCVW